MGDTLGGKIGTRIAEINSRAKLATVDRMTPLIVRTGMAMQEEFFRLTGSEVARTVGPLWRDLAGREGAPDWLRATAGFIADGRGQWATMLAGQTSSILAGGGILTVITNELQPFVGATIAANPHMPLSPADAAAVEVRGLSWGPELWTDAAQAGINRDRYTALLQVQAQVLAAGDVLELYRRGELTRARALAFLRRAGWDHDHAEAFLALSRVHISLPDAGAMWNRDIVSTEEGHALAVLNGYTPADFDRFAALGGEPPDLTATILAWQRGIIDESDVDRAIIQGPIRKEWIPVVKALRWNPLPASEAADAVNQGHMSIEDARHVGTLNGLKPDDFDVIVANAGIPPGPQEALDWVNRGILTEAQFREAFLESRIKNKYIDLYLQSRHTILTMAEIRSLYAKGAMDAASASARLQQRGYTAEDAGFILAGAHADRAESTKDLTKSEILSVYESRAVDRATAAGMLADIGFDPDETAWLLLIADSRRERKYTDAVVSRVHAGYVAYRLDTTAASSTLDEFGIPPEQRDELIGLWDLERQVVTRGLTVAQVQAALKRGLIDVGGAVERFVQQGYSPEDADILIGLTSRAPAG